MPGAPIQRPSGWAYLSLSSERSVIQRGPGVTSLPSGPGALSAARKGPRPLNSLPGRSSLAQMPWLGVAPSTATATRCAPPPFFT